jgi:hypothetical protein
MSDEEYSPDEVLRRRDEVLRRMLEKPPEPRKAKPKAKKPSKKKAPRS